jgi:peptidoglycan/xylan/chitin deacetylase (PgdA/CDA1 family)
MTVLCYHAVEGGWDSPMCMDPGAFAEHAEWLVRRTSVVPLQSAVQALGPDARLPRGTTALTFDDGFAGLHAHVTPVLTRLAIPATVFLVAETLTDAGRPVDWVDTPPARPLATLTLDQVKDMQAAGVSFESHSFSHLDLTRLSFQECVDDLTRSRDLLESLLGHPVRLLAYPRGRHNAAVREAAARAGYSHAFTLPEAREAPGPFAIQRVGIHRGNGVSHLRVKTARPYLGVRTGRGYGAAQRAVRAVRGARR